MDELVVRVVGIDLEGRRTRPQISFLKQVDGSIVVHNDPDTDVEFALKD